MLRLASGSNSRKRGRSPTAATSSSRSGGGEGSGRRKGILKRPRTTYGEPPEIIANVDDATIPIERDSDLTRDEKAAKHRRWQAMRQATAAQFYAAETVERVSFYEMLADGRRDFRLTFGMEQGQTFAMGDVPHAAAAPEEEEFAQVRLSEPEDSFVVGIVDLAMLAVQQDAPDLDRTVWDMVTSNVKSAVKVIHNVEKAKSLANHFAMEDHLEAKSNAHVGELVERAKARLEHVKTDPQRPAKAEAIWRFRAYGCGCCSRRFDDKHERRSKH